MHKTDSSVRRIWCEASDKDGEKNNNTGNIQNNIPDCISTSIFIAFPKARSNTVYRYRCTISLISQIRKLLPRVITLRIRKRMKPRAGGEHSRYVEVKEYTNTMLKLGTLSERAIEVQEDLYI